MNIIGLSISCITLSVSIVAVQVYGQDVEWELTDSYIGVGTGSPDAKLHIVGAGDSKILVEDSDTGAATQRELFEIKNKGNLSFNMTNTNANSTWKFVAGTQGNTPGGADSFRISKVGLGIKFQIFDTGNATLLGTLTQNSDRNAKQDIVEVNQDTLLSKVMALPISEWSYKTDPDSRHIGPMAQDFYRLFALGDTDTGLTSIDTAGVALAAVQGLHGQFEKVQTENRELKERLQEQEKRIEQLEMMVSQVLKTRTSHIELSSINN